MGTGFLNFAVDSHYKIFKNIFGKVQSQCKVNTVTILDMYKRKRKV